MFAYGQARDNIHCGPGCDQAFVGKLDTVDKDSCEVVRKLSGDE